MQGRGAEMVSGKDFWISWFSENGAEAIVAK